MTLQIQILYIDDCTDWQETIELVEQALSELQLAAEMTTFRIENDRQALQSYFVGSPTVLVNGADLFPVQGATAGLRLRSYWTEEGLLGHPTFAMILDKLSGYQNSE